MNPEQVEALRTGEIRQTCRNCGQDIWLFNLGGSVGYGAWMHLHENRYLDPSCRLFAAPKV